MIYLCLDEETEKLCSQGWGLLTLVSYRLFWASVGDTDINIGFLLSWSDFFRKGSSDLWSTRVGLLLESRDCLVGERSGLGLQNVHAHLTPHFMPSKRPSSLWSASVPRRCWTSSEMSTDFGEPSGISGLRQHLPHLPDVSVLIGLPFTSSSRNTWRIQVLLPFKDSPV